MSTKKRSAEYNLFTGKNGECYFNLAAANYEIILASSEGYKSRAGAENGIRSVQENSQITERFERKVAVNNEPFFVLKARNGQIIGKSETYSSNAAMEKGIASVMRNGTTTVIDDQKVEPIVIKLNSETYKLAFKKLTVEQLLALGDFSVNEYCLNLVGPNGQEELSSEQTVDLIDGMEFIAILKDIKFG